MSVFFFQSTFHIRHTHHVRRRSCRLFRRLVSSGCSGCKLFIQISFPCQATLEWSQLLHRVQLVQRLEFFSERQGSKMVKRCRYLSHFRVGAIVRLHSRLKLKALQAPVAPAAPVSLLLFLRHISCKTELKDGSFHRC